MENIKRLLKLLTPYKNPLLVGSVFLVLYSATNLAIPLFIKELVDVVMVQKNLEYVPRNRGAKNDPSRKRPNTNEFYTPWFYGHKISFGAADKAVKRHNEKAGIPKGY